MLVFRIAEPRQVTEAKCCEGSLISVGVNGEEKGFLAHCFHGASIPGFSSKHFIALAYIGPRQ